LWQIARSRKAEADMTRYDELLEKNQQGSLTEAERLELTVYALRQTALCCARLMRPPCCVGVGNTIPDFRLDLTSQLVVRLVDASQLPPR
jgi:hypothetical protein